MPPRLIIVRAITLALRLVKAAQSSSCGKSQRCGWKRRKASALLRIVSRSASSLVSPLRLPSSIAATIVMAFASPMPRKAISSSTVRRASRPRLLSTVPRIRCESCTAVSLLLPDPIKIAISSASLSAAAPLSRIFSRGRSSSANSLMRSLSSIAPNRYALRMASVCCG